MTDSSQTPDLTDDQLVNALVNRGRKTARADATDEAASRATLANLDNQQTAVALGAAHALTSLELEAAQARDAEAARKAQLGRTSTAAANILASVRGDAPVATPTGCPTGQPAAPYGTTTCTPPPAATTPQCPTATPVAQVHAGCPGHGTPAPGQPTAVAPANPPAHGPNPYNPRNWRTGAWIMALLGLVIGLLVARVTYHFMWSFVHGHDLHAFLVIAWFVVLGGLGFFSGGAHVAKHYAPQPTRTTGQQ